MLAAKQTAAAVAAASTAREPTDLEVARAMLACLRKAAAPRSLAQLATATKETYPDAGWNLARWLQALRRGQGVRPSWFAGHEGDLLSVGPGAGNVGARAGLPTPLAATAPAAPPAALAVATGGAAVTGGPGLVMGGPGLAAVGRRPAAAAAAASASASAAANGEASGTTDLEEDLFGNLDDL